MPLRTILGQSGSTNQSTSEFQGPVQFDQLVTFLAGVTMSSTTTPISAVGASFSGDVFFKSGRPWADVRHPSFGAKGDGTTDDTTAIQSAINTITALGGGIVYLPQGTYLTTAALTITDHNGVTIRGAGMDATTITSAQASANIITLTGSTEIDWIHICDLTLTFTNAAQSGIAISASNLKSSTVERVRITGVVSGSGITMTGGSSLNNRFVQCRIAAAVTNTATGIVTAGNTNLIENCELGNFQTALTMTSGDLSLHNAFDGGSSSTNAIKGAGNFSSVGDYFDGTWSNGNWVNITANNPVVMLFPYGLTFANINVSAVTTSGNFVLLGVGSTGITFADGSTVAYQPTIKFLKGSGSGDYTTTSTLYADVDGANLAYTVTVPTGWDAVIQASATARKLTGGGGNIAITDGTTLLSESTIDEIAAGGDNSSIGVQHVFAGDGSSHTFKLRYKSTDANQFTIANATSTLRPTIVVQLVRAN